MGLGAARRTALPRREWRIRQWRIFMSAVHTNRLANETSPYLLQHAHNPVDWYAWGPEAFAAARQQNKPIFLSVGYSTCYWCHVMERETFENPDIAAEMNRLFINIKVDREERPDVDQLYMLAIQLLTHQGGWPMSVFLTPDLKPFWGGTYFPPADTHGQSGFPTVIRIIEEAYRQRHEQVEQSAAQLLDALQRLSGPRLATRPLTLDKELVDRLVQRSTSDYDAHFGGFGSAPKFPRQTLLQLLLIHNRHWPDDQRTAMIRHTLDALDHGGIHDHLGGGFHRYSTDEKWLVPHFEIMLYDNALLAWVYIEAYRQTEHLPYAHVARGIFDFILREMTSPQGAFYTAFDAEVDGFEGLSYLWTPDEIDQILPPDDAALFKKVYGLDAGPNFSDPHHGAGKPDKNILFLPRSLDAVAADMSIDRQQLEKRLAVTRQLLHARRLKRKQPLLDTKILTSWNALMIRALAYGSKILQEPSYLDAAAHCARFLLDHHCTPDARLLRTSREGQAKTPAFLEDYAYLVQALLALNDAGGDESFKDQATAMAAVMRLAFADEKQGGFFFTDSSASDLLVRQKTATDSPLPSGSAVAAMVHLELNHPEIARQTLAAYAPQLSNQPESMSAMLETAVRYLQTHGPLEIPAAAADPAQPLSPHEQAAQIISLSAAWAGPNELNLRLQILEGWHLTGARLAVLKEDTANVAGIVYPPQDQWTGEVTISVHFTTPSMRQKPLDMALKYQACNANACLPETTLEFEIPVAGA